jgi:hypothetical protein
MHDENDDGWDDWDNWPDSTSKKPKWSQSRKAIIARLEADYDHSGLLIDNPSKAGNGSLGWAESIRAKAFHDALGYCLNILDATK